jgi:hypothetical protein
VNVVDIFGNHTMTLVEVSVRGKESLELRRGDAEKNNSKKSVCASTRERMTI